MNPLLYSNILGKGDPLVILHGFLGMSDNWKTLGSQYAENGLEVHLPDQRNHGKSFWSPTFNFDVMAEDLKAYLDHYSLKDILLIGHSMGGKTAMQFACNYPDLVKKLLVADIAPKYYPPHHDEIINALTTLDLPAIKSRNEADDALAHHISDTGVRQFLLKNLYRENKDRLAFRFNLEVISTKLEEIGDALGTSDNYTGPTLFLKGERSDYVTPADLPLIKSHFPAASIETISGAGHWLHAENPDEFLEKSMRFFRQ